MVSRHRAFTRTHWGSLYTLFRTEHRRENGSRSGASPCITESVMLFQQIARRRPKRLFVQSTEVVWIAKTDDSSHLGYRFIGLLL